VNLLSMMSEPDTPRFRPNRIAHGDPLSKAVERAYREMDRPAPKHASGCGCALCGDRAQARTLAARAARDWTVGEVHGWFGRVSTAETGRRGLQVASRTDRAVFRFLLPRIMELMATGALPADATTSKVFAQFEPGRVSHDGTATGPTLQRFGALLLDRVLHDPTWPVDVVSTLRLLACGGWALPVLVQQAQNDPELPASLARAWSRAGRNDGLFPGKWPAGAVSVIRAAFVTPLAVERMMNFAMADGTSHIETDDAMRAADMLLRNL
jgi:hypothetical protein